MRILIVIGTRPEIIKFAPLIRLLSNLESNFKIVHTNQHYDKNMNELFFEELEIPKPDFNLHYNHNEYQMGGLIKSFDDFFTKNFFEIVLVLGDTNSTLAAALSAKNNGITLGHVEAGLRSHQIYMNEELNRIVVDHISDFLFTPTAYSQKNLLREGISPDKIFVTGNTIVDAVNQNKTKASKKSGLISKLSLLEKKYFIGTFHRAENVDSKESLEKILELIEIVHNKLNLPLLWPIHPRTKKVISYNDIDLPQYIIPIDPLGYFDFLDALQKSLLVITDSGGIQEESCTLKVPCITIRESTERQETVFHESNYLVGLDKKLLKDALDKIHLSENTWVNPYGEGDSSQKIVQILDNISNL